MKILKSKGLVIFIIICIAILVVLYLYKDETGISETLGLDPKKSVDSKLPPQTSSGGVNKETTLGSILSEPELKEQAIEDKPKVSSRTQANEVLRKQKIKLGLGKDDDLTISGNTTDKQGNEYYQVTQTYKGIPIYGQNSTLEIEGGKAILISGSWQGNINVDINPKYDAKQSVKLGLKKLGITEEPEFEFLSEPVLTIIISEHKHHLAWRVSTIYKIPVLAPEVLFSDAHEPEILLRFPLEHQ